ncbi:MAG TPA: hypothetical protein VJZ76_23785, partial [Thermoanaerobaculia bacterium]|nr:hypothetical protein [Thermoanaerobaculia bacterium]
MRVAIGWATKARTRSMLTPAKRRRSTTRMTGGRRKPAATAMPRDGFHARPSARFSGVPRPSGAGGQRCFMRRTVYGLARTWDRRGRTRGHHGRTWDHHGRTWDRRGRTWDCHGRT